MREVNLSAGALIASLLSISETETVCILDSCGVSHLGSHLLIAGISPVETVEIKEESAEKTLEIFNRKTTDSFCIFTISYDFGLKLENIKPRPKEFENFSEPDIFLHVFDILIVHDYDQNKTLITGNENKFDLTENLLNSNKTADFKIEIREKSIVKSNFTRKKYIETVEQIKEFIRRGDTYQTNLTQQFRAELPEKLSPQHIFYKLRKNHPAPFAAFIKRKNDFVISASPERFFKTENGKRKTENEKKNASATDRNSSHYPLIEVSPIKGTRPRGNTIKEDENLRNELLNSSKDRAENVMIVDLLRNDIGRICKFGTVEVEKLCDLEEHPTFFHLVSTVRGELGENIEFSDIISHVFPCGSITGAPKIRTMQIIDELENAERGLSMGAIGFRISNFGFRISDSENYADLSVAIRTMIVKNNEAIFNVGGGIVIDSEPESEYEETLTKAKALLDAINGSIKF